MKKLVFIAVLLAFAAFIVACSSKPTDQVSGDAPPDIASIWDDSLKKYFSTDQIIKIKNAKDEFDRLKTSSELAHFYLVTLDSVTKWVNARIVIYDTVEYSGDNSPDVHWKWFNTYFPVVKTAVLCSECDYGAHVSLEPLWQKAKQTAGNEDDLYFDLAMWAENPEKVSVDIVYDGSKGGTGNVSGTLHCDRL